MMERIKKLFKRKTENDKENTKEKINYRDLAPIDDIDSNSEYLSALEWAVNNDKIKNIAISGTYGSGKSSIINSFIKKNKKIKCLKISMADFNEKKLKSKDLEEVFVKQLLYQVKAKRIPQSRYKKIKMISRCKEIGVTILCFLLTWFLCTFFVRGFHTILSDKIKQVSNETIFSSTFLYIIIIVVIVIIIYLIVNIAFKLFAKIRIREISIAGKAKAKIQDEGETSFHKDLDEIVYFFEKTKNEIVFIEDFDRFEEKEIFIKLRELNTILNSYEGINNRIIFVYAIKDDIFSNTDRIKFFDFILPVVSVVSSTNSGEVFLKMIDKGYGISKSFVESVSVYIDERRLLNNIYNEFITYQKIVSKNLNDENQTVRINNENLMALIIYKNICPDEFSDLQMGKGNLVDLLKRKKEFIKAKKESLTSKITETEDELRCINAEHINSVGELKIIMLDEISQNKGYVTSVICGGHPYYRNTIMDEDFVVSSIKGKCTINYYGERGGKSFSLDTQNIVNEFEKRCNILKQRDNNRIERLNNILNDNKEELQKIESYSMKDLLQNSFADELLKGEDKSKDSLLIFLLENGWINEDYSYYMNVFYGHTLKTEDLNFILSARDNIQLEYNYFIPNPKEVIKRMSTYEFERKEFYNFDVLDELMDNDAFATKRRTLLNHLVSDYDNSFSFIDQYIKLSNHAKEFMVELANVWDGFADYIFNESVMQEQDKEYYFSLICSMLSVEAIDNQNKNGVIKNYIESKDNALFLMKEIEIEKQQQIISVLDIKFRTINTNSINADLVEWILDNGLFALTIEMVEKIFELKKPSELNNIYKRNYTEIRLLNYAPLNEKINESVEEYVSNIILGLKSNNKESLESVLMLIEKNASIEASVELIKKQNVELEYLNQCGCDDKTKEDKKIIWDIWIKENKLLFNWNNIIDYWNEFGLTDELLGYIEKAVYHLKEYNNKEVNISDIDADVLKSDMSEASLIKWINLTENVELVAEEKEINENHMRILLENDYYDFSEKFAHNLRESHPNLYALGLERNEDRVISQIDVYQIDVNDIEYLINQSKWKPESIIMAIEANSNIVLNDNIYQFIRKTKASIKHTTFEKTWNKLAAEEKYELLINHIEGLNNSQLSELFLELGDDYQKLSDRSHSHKEYLANTEYNRELCKILLEKKYITSMNNEGAKISLRVKKRGEI